MEALGRLFNIVPSAGTVEVNLRDATGVTFLCIQDGASAETFTVQESQDASGTGAQNLAVIDEWHQNTAKAGATTWTRQTQTAAASVSVPIGGVAAIHVSANSLSDGYGYVECNPGATGTVVAIVHDLAVQRAAENLPAPAA